MPGPARKVMNGLESFLAAPTKVMNRLETLLDAPRKAMNALRTLLDAPRKVMSALGSLLGAPMRVMNAFNEVLHAPRHVVNGSEQVVDALETGAGTHIHLPIDGPKTISASQTAKARPGRSSSIGGSVEPGREPGRLAPVQERR